MVRVGDGWAWWSHQKNRSMGRGSCFRRLFQRAVHATAFCSILPRLTLPAYSFCFLRVQGVRSWDSLNADPDRVLEGRTAKSNGSPEALGIALKELCTGHSILMNVR